MTTIAALPPAPQPSDDEATFNAKAFAFNDALPPMVTQINTVATEMNGMAAAAAASQGAAATSEANALSYKNALAANASAAAASAGASPWVAGTYAAGVAARSTIDYRVYVARTSGSKPTDPSLDPTNWALASGNGLQLIVVTGTTQTAAPGARYVLTNAAQSTLTAPASPTQGDTFAVKVANGRTDNLIDWNGSKHEGVSDATMTLDGAYLSLTFVYINATLGWGIL